MFQKVFKEFNVFCDTIYTWPETLSASLCLKAFDGRGVSTSIVDGGVEYLS